MKPNKKAEKSQLRPELIRENSNAQKVPKEKTIAFYLIAMRMGGSAEGKAGFISLREDCHCVAPRREGKKNKKERKKERPFLFEYVPFYVSPTAETSIVSQNFLP